MAQGRERTEEHRQLHSAKEYDIFAFFIIQVYIYSAPAHRAYETRLKLHRLCTESRNAEAIRWGSVREYAFYVFFRFQINALFTFFELACQKVVSKTSVLSLSK